MNVILIVNDTLRRDHVSAYTGGKPLNQCWSHEAPDWNVITPNIDGLAKRGTIFTNCYCGSTPCMPARRDIYTGRYEFLERGWGPLEEEDPDLPRMVSGPPNRSLQWAEDNGYSVSHLVSDHFHLWEQGAGNYHMGYSSFDFIRGVEGDNFQTAPRHFPCPEKYKFEKLERHWRNKTFCQKISNEWPVEDVFTRAGHWLEKNHENNNFYLHIDCFNPHEPLDPPEKYVKMFDPDGYGPIADYTEWPYARWKNKITPAEFKNLRARYAAKVVQLDTWLGYFFNKIGELGLWENTIVILTTDHGTFNGDHGRTGKLQTHEFDAVGHIPFIFAHPGGKGDCREQLVQLVDLYPTVLAALGKSIPENIHGKNLLPVLDDACASTRDYAIMGQFGKSVSITDGRWILHQNPVAGNTPLFWYSHYLSKFMGNKLGPCIHNKREVLDEPLWEDQTWLSDKKTDMNELVNLSEEQPKKLREMQQELKKQIEALGLCGNAASEQIDRLGLKK